MFLNPNLSLEFLAADLNLSVGYLSQLFNEFTNMHFTTYINRLRVVACKKMLLNDAYENYTIAAIGLEAGFNSRSAFYKAFKKETNCSPTTFKKIKKCPDSVCP